MMKRADFQEGVNEPLSRNIDLRRLHETLAEIAAPWLEAAKQHEINKQIDIPADHRRRYYQTLGEPRAI